LGLKFVTNLFGMNEMKGLNWYILLIGINFEQFSLVLPE